MNGIINLLIVLLIVGWLIGFIGFGAAVGGLIHLLLILAVIGILYRLATGKRL
ncbi:lmo0937 family membrane protein [bacterium]|mgnify:CR=1 FL=1|nr:lmo0937 family membrane protein [bacterium]